MRYARYFPTGQYKSAAHSAARLRVAQGDEGTLGSRKKQIHSALPQAKAERNARSDKTKCIFLERSALLRASLRQNGVAQVLYDYPGLRPGLFSLMPQTRHSHSRREDRHCAKNAEPGSPADRVVPAAGVSGSLRQIGIEKASSQKL